VGAADSKNYLATVTSERRHCALVPANWDRAIAAADSVVPVNNSDCSLAPVNLDTLLAPVVWESDCALAPVNSDYSLRVPVNSDLLLVIAIAAADLNCVLARADFDTSPKMR
jgi:hypothetical protein